MPKDSYPLPQIYQLVDSTVGDQLYSLVDTKSGYHQIPMHQPDEAKTAFTTHESIYCYTKMPFSLKNAGATFQRMVNKMFKDKIGKNVEIYVNDMIVKSRRVEEHPKDLREVLEILRRFNLKLNLEKCVFGVKSGKFLGFMVSQKGIEANPDKI